VKCINIGTGGGAQGANQCAGDQAPAQPGEITITYDNTPNGIQQIVAANTVIVLTPSVNKVALVDGTANSSANVDWACASQGTTTAANTTNVFTKGTVLPKYAPSQCK
jgi:type IV pilus assembly protein PilA